MSVRVELPYGNDHTVPLDIPDGNLETVITPRMLPAGDPLPIIEHALSNPTGTGPLEDLVCRGQAVTVLIDDNTRPTPTHLLLPPVLSRLHDAGIAVDDITILIAGGTHRSMTESEIRGKVGAEIQKRYRVVNHEWMRAEQLVTVGMTENGIPVQVNRLVVEADFCIGIGDIGAHPLAGWSGGCKIVEPGVCGPETTCAVHGSMAEYPDFSFLGRTSSPIRAEIDRIGRRAGLRFIVNTVLNAEYRITAVVAGDPVMAHRAGIQAALPVWTCHIRGPADLVVASSYPADIDFWQAQKALYCMVRAVRRGGELILLTPCSEGISSEPHHRHVVGRYAGLESKKILRCARADGEWDLASANTALHMALIRETADITVVSDGLTAEDCLTMGFAHADDLQSAVDEALARCGNHAKVTVMTHGSKVVPVYCEDVADRGPENIV